MGRRKRSKYVPTHTTHHLLPVSREGGDYNNTVRLPAKLHSCWHELFDNLTTEEAIRYIRLIMVPNVEWTRKELARIRENIKNSEESRREFDKEVVETVKTKDG